LKKPFNQIAFFQHRIFLVDWVICHEMATTIFEENILSDFIGDSIIFLLEIINIFVLIPILIQVDTGNFDCVFIVLQILPMRLVSTQQEKR
jgi:hypothetical protein